MKKSIVIVASLPIMIAMMTAMSQTDLPLAFGQSPLANLSQGTNITNSTWKILNVTSIGLSIEHPSNWTDINLKQSRFEDKPDLSMSSLSDKAKGYSYAVFSIVKDTTANNPDLMSYAQAVLNSFTFGGDSSLIDNIRTDVYTIDGEKAANFVYTRPMIEGLDLLIAHEVVVTIHEGKPYIFDYGTYTMFFDSPKKVDERKHILNSIKWTD